MRHGKKFNHLGRKKAHREAMLMNMANSLIEHKRIFTTVAKAKALRKFFEPLVSKAKNDNMHSRRTVFSYLRNKHAVKELFGDVADRVGDRPGGYTRILKTENRLGDNAEMCMIELVDYNDAMLEAKNSKKATSTATKKRTRRGKPAANKANLASQNTDSEKQEDPKDEVASVADSGITQDEEATKQAKKKTKNIEDSKNKSGQAEVKKKPTKKKPAPKDPSKQKSDDPESSEG